MNVLDLGFFNALQSLHWKQTTNDSIDGLIENVQSAWERFDPTKLNRVWLTHMCCLDSIIIDRGGNDYKIPHIGKESLENQNALPTQIVLSDNCMEVLGLRPLEAPW